MEVNGFRKWMVITVFLLSAALGHQLFAQAVVPDYIVPDTVVFNEQYRESTRFFDKLKERSDDSRFARRLYRALVSEDDRHTEPQESKTPLEKEVSYYRIYEGQTVNSIEIFRSNVFSDTYSPGDFRTLANKVHVVTRENKIWRNILFKVGDQVSPLIFARNEQLLRSLSYLSDAYILVSESAEGEGVDVKIYTRDSWSIGLTMHSVPNSRRYLDIYDSNIMGTGNRLDLRTYGSYKGKIYGGNMLEFTSSNLWGSFFDMNVIVGKGYDERRLGVTFDKQFILNTDYLAGLTAEGKTFYDYLELDDSIHVTGYRNFEGWYGKSWDFPAVRGSYYLAARFQDQHFTKRPEVRPDSNTYYHSHRTLLLSTGIYRETFYKGNMIYGYGRSEDIPYGHKFELTGGRQWGEFEDKWVTGFTASVGRKIRPGYFRAEAAINSFWKNGEPVQSALEVNFDSFTNLWKFRRNYVRHFFSLRYLNGFDRLKGEGERVTFWEDSIIPGLRRDDHSGMVRMVVNTETVAFTPIYFYGFRFVFFGYADFGWLGDHNNPFRNDFYTAFGVGARFKNERLIFNTIQFRFGIALKSSGSADYRNIRFSSQRHFDVPQFKAQRPEMIPFR